MRQDEETDTHHTTPHHVTPHLTFLDFYTFYRSQSTKSRKIQKNITISSFLGCVTRSHRGVDWREPLRDLRIAHPATRPISIARSDASSNSGNAISQFRSWASIRVTPPSSIDPRPIRWIRSAGLGFGRRRQAFRHDLIVCSGRGLDRRR
jgi:hypothetical protein